MSIINNVHYFSLRSLTVTMVPSNRGSSVSQARDKVVFTICRNKLLIPFYSEECVLGVQALKRLRQPDPLALPHR